MENEIRVEPEPDFRIDVAPWVVFVCGDDLSPSGDRLFAILLGHEDCKQVLTVDKCPVWELKKLIMSIESEIVKKKDSLSVADLESKGRQGRIIKALWDGLSYKKQLSLHISAHIIKSRMSEKGLSRTLPLRSLVKV